MSTVTQTLTNKINIAFSDAVTTLFTQNRYGINGCRIEVDPYYIQDLKDILAISQELDDCETDYTLDTCTGCDLTTIQERIKTL